MAVTYDTVSNTVRGLLHGVEEGWQADRFLTMNSEMAKYAAHPLMIPLLAATLMIEQNEASIEASDRIIMGLEYETGQHPYSQHQKDPLTIDFVPVTRRLNNNGTEAGIYEMRTEQLLLLFDDLDKANDDLGQTVAALQTKQNKERSQTMRELTQYLRSQNQNLLPLVKHVQRKAQMQLSVASIFTGPTHR